MYLPLKRDDNEQSMPRTEPRTSLQPLLFNNSSVSVEMFVSQSIINLICILITVSHLKRIHMHIVHEGMNQMKACYTM